MALYILYVYITPRPNMDIHICIKYVYILIKLFTRKGTTLHIDRIFTLYSGCEIYGIEATSTKLFVRSFFSFTKTMTCVMFAP